MESLNNNNEEQNLTELDNDRQNSNDHSWHEKCDTKMHNSNASKAQTIKKENMLEITYEDFNIFLQDFFCDITKDIYEEIVSFPVIDAEDINANLYRSKCIYLSQNEINIDDLLVFALLDENDNNIEIGEKTYSDDICLKSFTENETVADEFFDRYKSFCEKIDLKSINIQDENKIMKFLKEQAKINNKRRKKLNEVLDNKLKTLSILKFLREIDKRIEKIVFKRIKNKRKRKVDDNISQILELIFERNKFYEAFKCEIDSAFNVLNISKSIFKDENIDISKYGFVSKNFFPDS